MRAEIPLLLASMWCAGCVHAPVPIDDLSAEEHRAEARRAALAAAEQLAEYDPNAAVDVSGQTGLESPARLRSYNPTDYYLESARRHEQEAREHLAAARELERFEDLACAGIPTPMRASCPLMSPLITRVEETATGVRLRTRNRESGAALAAQMKCHLAFARSRGYPAEAQCPLYFKGVTVDIVGRGASIDVRGNNAATAAAIHRAAAALFSPPAISQN